MTQREAHLIQASAHLDQMKNHLETAAFLIQDGGCDSRAASMIAKADEEFTKAKGFFKAAMAAQDPCRPKSLESLTT